MPVRQTKSAKDLEARVEFTATLLGLGLSKSAIKKRLIEAYQCSARTCETYLSRAKDLLVQWSGQAKQEHFVEAVAFYRSVIQAQGSVKDKLCARERLDALYGLEPPKENEHRFPDGIDVRQRLVRFNRAVERPASAPSTNGVNGRHGSPP
jgi:hypothetical protein